jgi:exopolysaccharide production protein ExoQ
VLAVIVLMQAMGRAASRLFEGRETYWALTYFAIFAIISMSESNLLGQNSLSWVLFCATAAKLAGGERALPPDQAGDEAP